MYARQDRWLNDIRAQEGVVAFTMRTSERLVVGLGAAHVLETAITLERNTGLPYIPGSAVKGIARTWGLFEVAAQLKYQLTDTEYERVEEGQDFLTQLASWLMKQETEKVIKTLEENAQNYDWMTLTDEAKNYINAF
ncbi:MAG: type III-B CRISPR module RAMP protein Cmr6, partial [Phototrophicales bacterium]